MDGDGLKDIVTGKRFWSHGRVGDPDRNQAAVNYWFRLVRGPDHSVDFIPYRIIDNSGSEPNSSSAMLTATDFRTWWSGNKKELSSCFMRRSPYPRRSGRRRNRFPSPNEPVPWRPGSGLLLLAAVAWRHRFPDSVYLREAGRQLQLDPGHRRIGGKANGEILLAAKPECCAEGDHWMADRR